MGDLVRNVRLDQVSTLIRWDLRLIPITGGCDQKRGGYCRVAEETGCSRNAIAGELAAHFEASRSESAGFVPVRMPAGPLFSVAYTGFP